MKSELKKTKEQIESYKKYSKKHTLWKILQMLNLSDIVLTYDCEQASCSNMLFLNYNILHSISNNRC